MKRKRILFALMAFVTVSCFAAPKKGVLIFGKTVGFHHESLHHGMAVLQELLANKKIKADTTCDASVFTPESLKKYKAVVFMNTTGDVLNNEQQIAFEAFIRKGGGYVGVHAAADTEFDWPFYGQVSGARFKNHPHQQDATIKVTDKSHPATAMLPTEWKRNDEWYDFKEIDPNIKVLAYLDESTYEGGSTEQGHPFIWYQQIGKGRVFYSGVGHRDDNFDEPLVRQHLLAAVIWVGKF